MVEATAFYQAAEKVKERDTVILLYHAFKNDGRIFW